MHQLRTLKDDVQVGDTLILKMLYRRPATLRLRVERIEVVVRAKDQHLYTYTFICAPSGVHTHLGFGSYVTIDVRKRSVTIFAPSKKKYEHVRWLPFACCTSIRKAP